MRSVVKHSYVKGAQKGARARAHVDYIQYRSGEDREKEPRSFFDDKRENFHGREVKQEIDKRSGKVIHKLILSPGVEGVDVKEYTRHVMHDLHREKGLDLNWAAVVHTNTDNPHAHVVIMGKDKNDREVQLRLEDCKFLRESGDRYLERHHEFDRYKDRAMDKLMKSPDYSPEGDTLYQGLVKEIEGRDKEPQAEPHEPYQVKPWDREEAVRHLPEDQRIRYEDQEYNKYSSLEDLKNLREQLREPDAERLSEDRYGRLSSWIGTKERGGEDYYEREAKSKWDKKERKKEKKRERQPGEDEREFKKLDKDLKNSFKELEHGGADDGLGRGYRERQRQAKGRLGAEHGHQTANQEIERLKREQELEPAKAETLDKQIDEVKRWDQDQREADSRWKDMDSMLGDRYGREQQELADLLRPYQQEPAKDGREIEAGAGKGSDREANQESDQEQGKPVSQVELEQADYDLGSKDSSWKDMDSMLGERFGLDSGREQGLEIEQSQQQMREFQDIHIAQEQTPKLEPEISRDDSDGDISRGGR